MSNELTLNQAFQLASYGVSLYECIDKEDYKLVYFNNISKGIWGFSETSINQIVSLNNDTSEQMKEFFRNRSSLLNEESKVEMKSLIVGEEGSELEIYSSKIVYNKRDYMLELIKRTNPRRKALNQEEDMEAFLYDKQLNLPKSFIFMDRLKHALSQVTRSNFMVTVIMISMSELDEVEINYGKIIMSELIMILSNKLQSILRQGDTTSKFSDHKFGVILSNTTISEVNMINKRIIDTLSKPIQIDEYEFMFNVRTGIATFTKGSNKNARELVREAKNNIQKIKNISSHEYLRENEAEFSILLKRAMDAEALEVYYQPQYHLSSGKVVSAEALLRWRHPEIGYISPVDFIPLAEEVGLINKLGFYVIEKVANDIRYLTKDNLQVKIGINLSVRQLLLKDKFIKKVKLLLNDIEVKLIEFEITESLIGEDSLINYIQELKELGYSIALDDFGSERSNLARVSVLPLDVIKLDNSFMLNIESDAKKRIIVTSIIHMAHQLGLKVVVEGVENKNQFDKVAHMKADIIQGNFISTPVGITSLRNKLKEQEKINEN
ncbi:putative bifunctional diguanylate cyclase/phosphodiesterase [Bacillus sp. es.036]|uniref:putative bifunctional diguanylate cyclase/phosphodiesterase n=1 Tax=Bacillus sp. es.036 TaxID=1761764 RepID=UPI0015CF4692|nr:bifunctional diguanylate cyclase/phosphodiesterase [Bacillus sp. es.036]